MTRRRRGRRPGDPREGAGQSGQPRAGQDGSPRQPGVYTPPASPLTRWQNHGGRAGGNGGRSRFAPPGYAGGRPDRRSDGGSPAPQRRPDERPRQRAGPDRPRPSGPANPPPPRTTGTIDPFELFCAYHLGITPDDGYRIQNIHEVARRFGTNAGELRQILAGFGMAADDIVHSGFDLASAQVDIMVAPEGISRRELARPLYVEFRSTPKQTRNWAREMEDAQRQIDQTLGRDGRWSPSPRDPAGKQS